MGSRLFSYMSQSAILLMVFSLVGVVLLVFLHSQTASLIAQNEREALLSRLDALLQSETYDNDLLHAPLEVQIPAFNDKTIIYRATNQGETVAAIFTVTTMQGYSGAIKLLVGVRPDQSITGVRVLSHKETPGLGDKIDLQKNAWILGFNDKSLTNPNRDAWKVKKDGGEFDEFTGATITPRAVVNAVSSVLLWSVEHDDFVFRGEPK